MMVLLYDTDAVSVTIDLVAGTSGTPVTTADYTPSHRARALRCFEAPGQCLRNKGEMQPIYGKLHVNTSNNNNTKRTKGCTSDEKETIFFPPRRHHWTSSVIPARRLRASRAFGQDIYRYTPGESNNSWTYLVGSQTWASRCSGGRGAPALRLRCTDRGSALTRSWPLWFAVPGREAAWRCTAHFKCTPTCMSGCSPPGGVL